MTLPTDTPRSARAIGVDRTWQAAAVTALLVALAFLPTWLSLPPAWVANRVHAFGLAAFAGWLLWRVRGRLRPSTEGVSLAVVPLLFLSLGWAVGHVLNVQLLHHGALPLILLGWLAAVSGPRAVVAALPAFLAFALVVPVWGLTVGVLQALTVVANKVLLALIGFDAEIRDTYIRIPEGVFEVARGCAGANYFESGVVIGAVYALLFLRTWQARGLAVLLAGGLAVASNWLRVFGLILIGHFTNMQSPLIREHNAYGWVIFAFVQLGFFVLTRRIEALEDRRVASGRWQSAALADTDADPPPAPLRRLLLPTVAATAGPLLVLLFSSLGPASTQVEGTGRLVAPAGWQLTDSVAIADGPASVSGLDSAAWRPAFSGADRRLRERWSDVAGEVVQVDRLLYVEQAQGKEMISEQNAIAAEEVVRGSGVVGPVDSLGRLVNATVVAEGEALRLVWSWYDVAGVRTHSRVEAKLLELAAFLRRSPVAALLAVSTPCEDERCEAAGQRLMRFVTGRPDGVRPAGSGGVEGGAASPRRG